jgi:hypothetical protein
MENIIQMLIPLIIVILTFVLSNSRRRKRQRNVQREREENVMPEGDVEPQPSMQDFPFETRLEEMILQQDEAEDTSVVEEPEPIAVQEPVDPSPPQPPPLPVESPAGIRSVPATSLLDLSPGTFRQGIILREILDRPRALRRGAPFRYRRDL